MRKRRVRSFYVVFTLLLVSPGLLAAAHAFLLPRAIKAGMLDGVIEDAVGDALGTPVRIDSARLRAKDLLEIRGLRLAAPSAGFRGVVIDEVILRFDGPVPMGAPAAIELARLEAAFDLDALRAGDDVRVSTTALQDLRRLPAIDLRAARLKVHSGDAVDVIDEIIGRYAPGDGAIEVAGNFAGAGPGTFRLSGRVDPVTGAPSLSVVTQRPALPLNIERILSRLADAPVRTAAEHTMVLTGGRVSSASVAFDPGLEALQDGPFTIEMDYGAERLSVSAGIPPVEIDLDPYRVVVSGGFRLINDDGTARFQIHVHEGDSEEHLEEADLLLYDLRVEGDALRGEGSLLLADGREILVRLEQTDVVKLSLSATPWDLSVPWRLPWALARMDAPALEGTADLSVETTLHDDGVDVDAIVNGVGLKIEDQAFAGASARLKIRRPGDRTTLEGVVDVSRDNALVSVTVAAERAFGAWTGRASGTARWSDRPYALSLPRWSYANETFTAEGELTLPGGSTAALRRVAYDGDWSVEAEVARLDLSLLDPAWLPVDAVGGTIDQAQVTWAPDAWDVTVAGEAWLRRGEATFRFTGLRAVRDAEHRVRLDGARVEWRDLEFDTPRLEATVREDRADEFGRLPIAWTVTLAGGRFLRGSRLVDTGGAAVTLEGEGTWWSERAMLEGQTTARIDGWGESHVKGWIAGGDFALTVGVADAPLSRVQEALSLVTDVEAVKLAGTLSGHAHVMRDAAGFSLSGEIARAQIDSIEWQDWRFEGVTLRMPLELGVPRRERVHEHELAGSVKIRQATYPGGRAKELASEFTARRAGEAWEVRAPGELAGTFCNGTVAVSDVAVTLGLDGASSARLGLKLRGLDMTVFGEIVGMDKPLTGTFDADYADVRVSDTRIDFGGGKMTGQGLFSGTWTVDPLWIEDPFGPDTSYGFSSTFDDVNLRHVSRYLIDSSVTRHGLIHGRAGGEFHLKMLHDGDVESFEVYTHTQRRNDVRQIIYRDAARTLASTFGRPDLAREMKQLPDRPTYYGLSLFAKMELDRKVWLYGGFYKARAGEPAREYTLEEIRARTNKGEDFILIGSGLHKVDIPVSMIDQPIDWEAFVGRLDPDAEP